MLRNLRRLARGAALIAIGVLATATAPWIVEAAGGRQVGPAAAPREASNIPTGRADAVEALGMVCATSDEYVNLPGMTLVFTQGARQRRPVIVQFSGQFGGFGSEDYMLVRVKVDGAVQPGTGAEVNVTYPGSASQTNGFTFFTAGLAPGNHRVTLQYAATMGPGAPFKACMGDRTMVVLHG